LIVVDGSTAQINATKSVLEANNLNIKIVATVKDERHKVREIINIGDLKNLERQIILANSESHRFAVKYHQKLRDKIRP
jgi:excinuclease UvrABC nuclease subunit